ncbi:kinesin-like protein KIN-7F [Impatiens glandulifera]|uniref:kinesin-like protein KIN-7F n=1 Tax=Impatiens glandulifera TaxID=253017 RepID=UPI001FB0D12E|nr:kinesin-like protein KIN-7F [Impatiens glandulifera]
MGVSEAGEQQLPRVVVTGTGGGGGDEERILVSVRLRPLNDNEIAARDVSDWECINDNTVIYKNGNLPLPERSMYPTSYTFDRVFRSDCSTKQVYQSGAKEVALSVINGINSTVFAYGQTSSGKTHTMSGITEYTIADIYNYIEKHMEREFILKFSAMEIYNESVKDLLTTDNTPLRLLDDPERGTVVEKLTEEPLRDWNHVMELLSICEAQRQVGETLLNEVSSRSHQIIRLTIDSCPREFVGRENSNAFSAAVNFVDLAGSERASATLSAGTRLKEGSHINRSLLSLGTVIRKLSKGRNGHIPFRDSKLTRILQSSLGGNARTAIICTMSPARCHVEQSRNTLLFASCAKEVATNAHINVVMSDKALVKQLQRELARLETELRSPRSTTTTVLTPNFSALVHEKDFQIERLEKEVINLTLQRDVARSQVHELLQQLREERDSRAEMNTYPHIRVRRSPEYDGIPVLNASVLASVPSYGIRTRMSETSQDYDGNSDSDSELNYEQSEHDGISSKLFVNTSNLEQCNYSQDWEDIDGQSDGISEELCKEVRCIETENASLYMYSEMSASSPDRQEEEISELKMFENENENNGGLEFVSSPTIGPTSTAHGSPFNVPSQEQSPWTMTRDVSFRGKLQLNKSRSCKASFVTDPQSNFFEELHGNESTPPNGFEKEFSGRPEGIQRKHWVLNYESDAKEASEPIVDINDREEECDETPCDMNMKDVTTCFEPKEEMTAELRDEKQITDAHVDKPEAMKNVRNIGLDPMEDDDDDDNSSSFIKGMSSEEVKKEVKDVGLDPILEDDSKSISNWDSEFKRLQREIIELWHICNASLVHRAYFFLLFKGDPSDSIYMEVELRRLSFLKETFANGGKIDENGNTLSNQSSLKALRREREMLTKQMERRLSVEERECLFLKWGIKLNSKYRRLQLASMLWSKTDDMEHISECAYIITKLVGSSEPKQAAKEMFALNFAPHTPQRRSYSIKRSVISIL